MEVEACQLIVSTLETVVNVACPLPPSYIVHCGCREIPNRQVGQVKSKNTKNVQALGLLGSTRRDLLALVGICHRITLIHSKLHLPSAPCEKPSSESSLLGPINHRAIGTVRRQWIAEQTSAAFSPQRRKLTIGHPHPPSTDHDRPRDLSLCSQRVPTAVMCG